MDITPITVSGIEGSKITRRGRKEATADYSATTLEEATSRLKEETFKPRKAALTTAKITPLTAEENLDARGMTRVIPTFRATA